jgi:FKBP-type peptidyl-prolyl cis-trans isomerase FkpA
MTNLLPAVLLAAAAAACGDSPTVPSTAPYKQTDVLIGTGAEATTGSVVSVMYTGWLYDASKLDGKGAQFDTSVGGDPFAFTLGVGEVIKGWDQGVTGMKVGGLRRLIIPPSLGYGAVRFGPIPPDATLVFDIELTNVQTSSSQ